MSNNQSSKSRYSQRKQEISQAVQRHNNNRGRIAQRGANKEYKKAKAAYREAAKNYREGGGAEALKLKKKSKENLRIARKTKKIVKKTNPTKTQKITRAVAHTGTSAVTSYISSGLSQDEDLEEIVKHTRTSKNALRSAKKGARGIGRVSKATGRGVVKGSRFAKRSTKSAGRVAKRTAKNARRAAQASVKGARRALQVAQLAIKAAAAAVNGAIAFFATPVGWVVAVILALMLLVVMVTGVFSSNIVQQTDFSLNDSWVQLSKTDRKKSNDKVEYYTDIDEILLYMNYRYGGEWEPSAKWEDGNGGKWAGKFGLNHFSDALDDIWKQENEDPNNLKTMKDVYTNGKEWTKLSKSDREEYEEILENSKESGKYPGMQELQNPLYNAADDKSQSEGVMIEKRYGYTAKDKFSYNTTIKASSGQKLYAPMDGKVEVGKSTLKTFKTNLPKDKKESEEKKQKTNLIIYTDDAEFIFYNVSGARVKSGDKIEEGTELGSVQGNGQEIAYAKRKETLDKDDKDDKRYYDEAKYLEKRDEDNEDARTFTRNVDKKGKKIDKWQIVNPGFYFPFVAYSQHTQVTTTETAGEMSGRAKQLYDLVKKSLPEATDNGIAAMAGCFGVESQIEPKRAEGDYLSPPVGASADSWENEEWLNMGGPAIYGGGFPNILHRGLGLGQWTDTADGATRHTLLLEYAKKIDKKWYTLDAQIRFMLEGDNPYYINILKSVLTSNDDVDTLTSRFLSQWEGVPGDKISERQKIAKQALTWFHQTPKSSGTGSGPGGTKASSWDFPSEYEGKLKWGQPSSNTVTGYPGNNYPAGQCTFYVWNRVHETWGLDVAPQLGNGQDWVANLVAQNGWHTTSTPQVGAVCSTAGGFDGTLGIYGHVMFVEHVNDDGSFLISELNYTFVQDKVHWRVVNNASYYSFAMPPGQ